jgi:hypothetical protein
LQWIDFVGYLFFLAILFCICSFRLESQIFIITMTSEPPEEETENPIDVAETEKFEFGKGYDLSYFKDIRVCF